MIDILDKIKDILTDIEMTTVDTGSYIDSAKEKLNDLITILESEGPGK